MHLFTFMQYLVSDQASHFKNRVMKPLAEEYSINQTFTVSYSAMTQARALQILNIEELQGSFYSMHKNVCGKATANRKEKIAQYNKRTHMMSAKFQVGDFVVVGRAQNRVIRCLSVRKGGTVSPE